MRFKKRTGTKITDSGMQICDEIDETSQNIIRDLVQSYQLDAKYIHFKIGSSYLLGCMNTFISLLTVTQQLQIHL